jgi:excisionase family DNA binding protein
MTNQTNAQQAKPNPMLKARDVAALLNVSASHVWEMCRQGRLAYVQIGSRNIRIAQSDVDEFLTEQRTIGSR